MPFLFFYNNIWEKNGLNTDRPFAESLANSASIFNEGSGVGTGVEDLDLPSSENVRMFAANVGFVSVAQGQGSIEFLEASPAMVATLINGGAARPDDSVSSIINVIFDPIILNEFFISNKKMFLNAREKLDSFNEMRRS